MPEPDRRSRWTRALASWTLTLVGLLVLTYVLGVLRAPDLPDEAPAFTSRTTHGEPFELMRLRGRPVVLNFWAIWCGPCRFETPAILRFAARHPDVAVIGVVAPESPERVRTAVSELEITYPVVRGTTEIFDAYGVDTFPTTVFIDAKGHVVSAHVGLMLDPQFEVAALSSSSYRDQDPHGCPGRTASQQVFEVRHARAAVTGDVNTPAPEVVRAREHR